MLDGSAPADNTDPASVTEGMEKVMKKEMGTETMKKTMDSAADKAKDAVKTMKDKAGSVKENADAVKDKMKKVNDTMMERAKKSAQDGINKTKGVTTNKAQEGVDAMKKAIQK